MNVTFFLGPTLPKAELLRLLPRATVRGPAECGDILRVARTRPAAIALVDGVFEQRRSVWHKEILWALSEGIRVYGAASMGALRGAELSDFGMAGVGRVFEGYKSGELEDDDEVAIVHDGEERGYRPRSEAMVNLRVTVARAVLEGIIAGSTATRLVEIGKGLHYPLRNLETISQLGRTAGLPSEELDRLGLWIAKGNRIDQKRLDALSLVDRIQADFSAGEIRMKPPVPLFRFSHTEAWQELVNEVDADLAVSTRVANDAVISPEVPGEGDRLLAAAYEISPSLHSEVWGAALERAFALSLADNEAISLDAPTVQALSEEIRRRRGLLDPQRTEEWLRSQSLEVADFSALVYEEALTARKREQVRDLARAQVKRVLQLLGRYGEAVERASVGGIR